MLAIAALAEEVAAVAVAVAVGKLQWQQELLFVIVLV